ncbi:MAG TPA: hypothetical protein VHW46_14760 [Terracidiphilus sp.]|jgi:hypothetical protein|nr:hypothetical protein [Terracidiphilus sp.]
MANNASAKGQILSLDEIAKYHEDIVSSLKSYFNEASAYSTERFFGYTVSERGEELTTRIDETTLRSILIILASLEAGFRVDYELRCQQRLKDDLSRTFRAIYKEKENNVSLERDIFEAWNIHAGKSKALISELRAAFKLRHWLAHGRYWQPKLGRTFNFDSVFDLAVAVNEEFFGDGSMRQL